MTRALVALLFTVTAFADQPIAPPRFGPSPEYQFSWALATNGENYLAAWSSRERMHFASVDEQGAVLRDAAFGSAADVLDAAGIGRDYLVVESNAIQHIDGTTLDVKSTHAASIGRSAVIAAIGQQALLAMSSGVAQTLDANGSALGGAIQFADRTADDVAIAAARDEYLIVWLADGKLMRNLVAGGSASPASLIESFDAGQHAFGRGSIASNGDGFLLAWRARRDIRVVALAHDGTPVAPPATIASYDYTSAPQLAWNGRDYVMLLETRDLQPGADVVSLHLDTRGNVTSQAQLVAGGPRLQFGPAVASTTRSTFAQWSEFATCYTAGYGGLMGRTIEPLGETSILSRSVAAQESPDVVASSTQTLVAWTERGGERHVRATLLPSGVGIDVPATAYAQDSPSIATDGSSFLLTWSELSGDDCSSSLSAVVVHADGTLGTPTKLASDVLTTARAAVA